MAELQGLTAADLAGWDDWEEKEEEEDGHANWGAADSGFADWGDGQQQHVQQQYREPGQYQGPQEAVALEWDEPDPEPAPAAAFSPMAEAPCTQRVGTAAAQPQAPASWQPAAGEPDCEAAAVDVCFDDDEEVDVGSASGFPEGQAAIEQQQGSSWDGYGQASQAVGQFSTFAASRLTGGRASPSAAASFHQHEPRAQQAGQTVNWPAWGQCQLPRAEPAPGTTAAPGSLDVAAAWAEGPAAAESSQDVWAAFDAACNDDAHGSQRLEAAVEVELWDEEDPPVAATSCRVAAAETGAGASDPWAALGAPTEAPPSGMVAEPLQADAACGETSRAFPPTGADAAVPGTGAEEEPAAAAFAGLWGCDMQWEDEGPEEDAAVPAQRGQDTQRARSVAAAGRTCQNSPSAVSLHSAGPSDEHATAAALDWQYFDEADLQAGFASTAGAAGPACDAAGAAARLAAALGTPNPAAAVQAHAASARRHEDIGAAIIRALLEEQRQERVDLQPLLAQLCGHLAAALEGGSCATVVPLSMLRRRCSADVAASPQASQPVHCAINVFSLCTAQLVACVPVQMVGCRWQSLTAPLCIQTVMRGHDW